MFDTANIILIVLAVILGAVYFSIRGARKSRERRAGTRR